MGSKDITKREARALSLPTQHSIRIEARICDVCDCHRKKNIAHC